MNQGDETLFDEGEHKLALKKRKKCGMRGKVEREKKMGRPFVSLRVCSLRSCLVPEQKGRVDLYAITSELKVQMDSGFPIHAARIPLVGNDLSRSHIISHLNMNG